VLAKANRVTSAADYKRIVRSGRRRRGALTLTYARAHEPGSPLRMGVIVAKNVGGAVVRIRVRRRIKAIGWELAHEVGGVDVVVRALPPAADARFAELEGEVRSAVRSLAGREAAA
jgi:ribonuclease P protein component